MTLFADLQSTLALAQQGQYKAAIKSARAGMRKHKKHPAFPNFAAVSLCAIGKEREAVPLYQKALKLDPQFHDARRNLGMALAAIKQPQKAILVLTKAVKNNPNDSASWLYMAVAKLSLDDLENAQNDVAKALEIAPNDEDALTLNVDILEKSGRISAALAAGQDALKRAPHCLSLINLTAGLLSYQGQYDDALAARQRAVALAPQNVEALIALANQLLELGDQPEAHAVLLKVLDLLPAHPEALEQLSTFQTKEQNAVMQKTVLSALSRCQGKDTNRSKLLFSLAHIDRQAGDALAAAEHYVQANREVASFTPYDRAEQKTLDRNLTARYPSPMQTSLSSHPDPRPIYVVGLPRSGTTLTETILGAHPDVAPLGERRLNPELKPTFLNDLPFDPKAFAELQHENLPPLPDGTRAFVDKWPENHRYIGVLKSAFGNAHFINLRRDPRDVALSQWQGHFSEGAIPYSYDLQAMAHRFNLYAEIMAHWHKIMPGEILDMPYEDLVGDIETSSKKMASHCGLEWTPSMTEPHKHAGQVRTMSLHQVRQPVHSRSVRKWVRHEEMLAPFVAELDPNLWPEIR